MSKWPNRDIQFSYCIFVESKDSINLYNREILIKISYFKNVALMFFMNLNLILCMKLL